MEHEQDTDDGLRRWYGLFEELKTSVSLLRLGLGALQRIDGANDFSHLPMLLLASGFERLMKCIWVIAYQGEHGHYPSHAELKQLGHKLVHLRDLIVERCSPRYATERPCGATDLEYITQDPLFCDLLEMLSAFALSSRYHYLDLLCGRPVTEEQDPNRQFARMELRVLRGRGLLKRLAEPRFDPYSIVNPVLVSSFERFARALCRLFTLADLPEDASRFSGLLHPFLTLRDDQLGRTDYKRYNR